MSSERLRKIEELFHELIRLPPDLRREVLEERCADDPDLLAEIEPLLDAHEKAESENFLAPPGSTAFKTTDRDSSNRRSRRTPFGTSVHVRCPNCNIATEIVVPTVPDRVICPSCQHSFPLPGENRGWVPWNPLHGEKTFGRFEILEFVGYGAFGNVYKALDPNLQKVVALKILRAGSHDRFVEDARSSAQLRHPSIVSAHEVSTHEGTPFLVSDFIDGVTLADWLRVRRPEFTETARLLKILAEALEYAHGRGVIHRDFKPTNIMIDKEDKPYLLDFGLAKREASEVTMTLDGQILGTAAYMSPEQARGDAHHVNRQSDVYSLGVVLYEMLTGEPPFRGSLRMLLYQVLNDEPRAPRSINEQIPRDLETICLRCLSKEPARRYPTAGEVADELGRYLKNEPIKTRPISKAERLWRWMKRNPKLAGSLGATAASLLAVAGLSAAFAWNRGMMLAESKTRLAQVNFELGRAAFDRGDIGQGLHHLRRTLDAATEAGNADWARVSQANLAAWSREHPTLKGVFSHEGSVRDVAISPDGKRALTASDDGTARVWDVASGSMIHILRHDGIVYSAAFDHQGKTIVTTSADGSARLWDVASGRPKGEPMRHANKVTNASFSPDDKLVATVSEDNTTRLWDTTNGQPRHAFLRHLGSVKYVAFSPDSQTIATTSTDQTTRLWSTVSGLPVGDPLRHDSTVWVVAFSPDGRTIATASADKTARLWDVASGRELQRFPQDDQVYFVAFSPDGRTIATASADKTARLWDVATGQKRGEPLRHDGPVGLLSFSEDGLKLVTASVDQSARIWEVADGRAWGRPLRHASEVYDAEFSRDGSSLITCGSDSTAKLWDLTVMPATGRPMARAGGSFAGVFSPNGQTVLIGADGGLAIESDPATGQERGQPFRLDGPDQASHRVTAVAYRPDGGAVLIGDDRGFARFWQVEPRRPLGDPLKIPGAVVSAVFSADGKTALISGHQGVTQLADATTGNAIGKPIPHGQSINNVTFSPDGQTVLTVSDDQSVRLWDAGSGEPRGNWGHPMSVEHAEFSPDGQTVLTACLDGFARRWDLRKGVIRGKPLKHQGPVVFGIYSHDGKTILTATRGGMVRLWDAETGEPRPGLASIRQDSTVFAVAFSPDDRTVVTGARDGVVQVWDVALGRPLGPAWNHPKTIRQVAFNLGGTVILTRSDDATIRLWDLPRTVQSFDRLSERIESLTGLRLDDQGAFEVLGHEAWWKTRQGLRPVTVSKNRDANPLSPEE